MAKRNSPKPDPAPQPEATAPNRRDSVGWGFWIFCFAALAVPSWYASRGAVYESDRDGLVPYVMGFALAALGAGVLSYLVNLYYRMRVQAERKAARKRKK